MSILPEELVAYASVDFPGIQNENFDTSSSGGGINDKMRIIFNDIPAPVGGGNPSAYIRILPSQPLVDTGLITVVGRAADGTKITETLAANTRNDGNYTKFTNVFERILAVYTNTTNNADYNRNTTWSPSGSIEVSTDTGNTIGYIYSGEHGFTRLFINAFSEVSQDKDYYMKFFWKNKNSTNTLINASIREASEYIGLNNTPSERISHAVASSIGDSFALSKRVWNSGESPTGAGGILLSQRITASGFKGASSDSISVPGSNLPPGQAIGVWLKFSLPSSTAPIKGTYTSQIFGLST